MIPSSIPGNLTPAAMPRTTDPQTTPPPSPPAIGYRDVHNACHFWLLQHDPAYARDHAAQSARSQIIADRRTQARQS